MAWIFSDEMRFYLHDNETLLDGLKRTQHRDVRFECQEGYCGACRMRLVSQTGELHYKQPPLADLAQDEVLACCCLLTGSAQVSYQMVLGVAANKADADDGNKH